MADVLTPEQRQRNMSRIRGRDTTPEMLIRRGLHARGLRFRVQRKDLPGRPDLVFPRHRCVIQVHGCFWHRHGCPMSMLPKTRPEFWETKLTANVARDRDTKSRLLQSGWRVGIVWECAVRGSARIDKERLFHDVAGFVESGPESFEVSGQWKV